MNKTQSRNQQDRAVRAILERRKNDHLDATAFEGLKDVEHTKDGLVHRKKAINSRIGHLNALIERADAVRREGGSKVPVSSYGGWKVERSALVMELHDVEARLRELKHYSASAREERLRAFNTVFVDIAREMLAADVFSRIQLATVHRIAERAEAEKVAQ